MSYRSCFLWVLLSLLGITAASAQIVEISVETERAQYLLFEPVMLRITLRNNSGQDLVFEKPQEGERGWLNFVLTRSDNAMVKPDQTADFDRLLLHAGESRALVVNITPLYSFRETGPYRVRVVAEVSGRQFLSSTHEFTIINGHRIWQEKKAVEGSLRTYSLIRFTPTPQNTYLYLRVEDEAENLVYTTTRLGEIIAFTDPQALFDPEGQLHLLHISGKGVSRYTRADPDGILVTQQSYSSVNNSQPQLLAAKDGGIMVAGGRREDEQTRRERLSEAQKPHKKSEAKALPTVTAAPDAKPPAPQSSSATTRP